jgi:agmatine deiminase
MAKPIIAATPTPAELGYSMVAEWEPHEATWLGWPHNATDWPGKLDTIRWVYGEMVRKISSGELVRILVRHKAEEKLARDYLKRAGCNLKQVQFIVHPTNRGWTRDTGPIFVRRHLPSPLTPLPSDGRGEKQRACAGKAKGVRYTNRLTKIPPSHEPALRSRRGNEADSMDSQGLPPPHVGGYGSGVQCANLSWEKSLPEGEGRAEGGPMETAIVHFHFNAWAKYPDWQKDRKVPETAARLLGKQLFHAQHDGKPFVLEGGGIEVNGRGTLLTTEECYLHPKVQVRNPGLVRKEFDETVKQYLGVTNVLWLCNGPVGDDTHGHIDDICRFVNRKTVVLIRETNRKDINYRPLAENWERIQDLRLEDGSKPQVVPLPMPAPLYFAGDRLPASYANFYISNAAVIVPTFNDPNDRVALGILGELFTDRPVVGIHAVDLVLGFGSLHCLTQQQPI